LIQAGLLASSTRATRPLWPPDPAAPAPEPLSQAEREKAAAYRVQAARKLKMASVLAGGDLADEARAALLEAVEPLGRALAVENRLPEPPSVEAALLPPRHFPHCAAGGFSSATHLNPDFLRLDNIRQWLILSG
jgi:hypothetical protein